MNICICCRKGAREENEAEDRGQEPGDEMWDGKYKKRCLNKRNLMGTYMGMVYGWVGRCRSKLKNY